MLRKSKASYKQFQNVRSGFIVLQREVASLKSQVTSFKSQDNVLQSEVLSLKSQVAILKSEGLPEVANLKSQVTSAHKGMYRAQLAQKKKNRRFAFLIKNLQRQVKQLAKGKRKVNRPRSTRRRRSPTGRA